MTSVVKKTISRLLRRKYKESYAQSGEDMVLNTLCCSIKKGVYVDVGAHDPYYQSNTAFFYKKGWHGINIDANPHSVDKLKAKRKRDVNINAVISDTQGFLDYYIHEKSTFNTVNKNKIIPEKLITHQRRKTATLTSICQTTTILSGQRQL